MPFKKLNVPSLLQPLRLTGGLAGIRRRTYVYAARWAAESPFAVFYQRFRDDPSWTARAPDSGHNLMRDAPEGLRKILLTEGPKYERAAT